MFGWVRSLLAGRGEPTLKPPPDSGLMLGVGDRSVVKQTKGAKKLAHELLQEAQQKAAKLKSGDEVTVEVSEPHFRVHIMELSWCCMEAAGEYGLRVVIQVDNQFTFAKI